LIEPRKRGEARAKTEKTGGGERKKSNGHEVISTKRSSGRKKGGETTESCRTGAGKAGELEKRGQGGSPWEPGEGKKKTERDGLQEPRECRGGGIPRVNKCRKKEGEEKVRGVGRDETSTKKAKSKGGQILDKKP